MKNPIPTILFIIILIVLVLIFFLPSSTDINLHLDATQIDAYGNTAGRESILITGQKLDCLFQEDRLCVDVSPIGNIQFFGTHEVGGSEGRLRAFPGSDYLYTSCNGLIPVDDNVVAIFGELCISADLDRWLLCIRSNEGDTYYVASVSGNYTTEELVEYFRGVIPWDLELVS